MHFEAGSGPKHLLRPVSWVVSDPNAVERREEDRLMLPGRALLTVDFTTSLYKRVQVLLREFVGISCGARTFWLIVGLSLHCPGREAHRPRDCLERRTSLSS